MSWNYNTPPAYKPTAVATNSGWTDPANNSEILVAINRLANKALGANIIDVDWGAASYARTDAPTVIVRFNEKVDVTAGATLSVTSTEGAAYTATAAEQLNAYAVTFTSTALRDEATVLSVGAQTVSGTIADDLSNAGKSVAFISFPTKPVADENVIVGSTTYVFKATVASTASQVLIGANAFESLQNLCRAINLTSGGSAVWYGSSTVVNASAVGLITSDGKLKIEAKVAGVAGNSVTCTTTVTDATVKNSSGVTATTLESGTAASSSVLTISAGLGTACGTRAVA